MAINPNAPVLPEKDITLLNVTPDLANASGYYPEIDISLLPGVPGQRGPTGPTGPAASQQDIIDVIIPAVSYQHVQIAAASTWTINHNLHFPPNITAFDSGGSQVEGNVVHINANTLTIQFSVAISGNAVLS